MNTAQVEALRALLASTGWPERTGEFAGSLRRRAAMSRGLLIVGTPASEPWHMTAHLADEFRLAGLPELAPTLVRWAPPAGAPAHLNVGIDRLERASRTETLLVVSPDPAPEGLLERIADAKRAGTAILALDQGDQDLDDLAHEYLSVPPAQAPVSFDLAQHLVSLAIGDPRQRPGLTGRAAKPGAGAGIRARLAWLLDAIGGPQPG